MTLTLFVLGACGPAPRGEDEGVQGAPNAAEDVAIRPEPQRIPVLTTSADVAMPPPGAPEAHTAQGPAADAAVDIDAVDAVMAPQTPGRALGPDCRARLVSLGGNHGCAISEGGDVYCWGDNGSYELGTDAVDEQCVIGGELRPCSTIPLRVTGMPEIVDLALSSSDSCALDREGGVWCWGVSQSDVLSNSPQERCDLPFLADPSQSHLTCSPSPVRIAGIDQAISIGGWGVQCAAEQDGTVKCWVAHMGRTPTAVPGITGAVQTDFACGRREDGRVQCWWLCNDRGGRGDGTLGPAQLPGVPSECQVTSSLVDWDGQAVDVSSGYAHACLVDADGGVACWGDNRAGQLGVPASDLPSCNDEVSCSTRPLRVPGIQDAAEVAAGYGFTCIRDTPGGVQCMGNGVDRRDIPLPAPAIQIAARYGQACAVLEDGRLFCWSGSQTDAMQVPLCAHGN